MKIPERPDHPEWEYDPEADVLYLSIDRPRPAVGVDIGDGLIVRVDETRNEVAGLTVIGLRSRLLEGLASSRSRD